MSKDRRFTPASCRAARGLLAWSAEELARRAGLELEAVELFEAEAGELGLAELARVQAAFDAVDVIAIPERLAGEGARFRHPRTAFASAAPGPWGAAYG